MLPTFTLDSATLLRSFAVDALPRAVNLGRRGNDRVMTAAIICHFFSGGVKA